MPPRFDLDDISLEEFIQFLVATGWDRIEHPNENLNVFAGKSDEKGERLKLVLPQTMDFRDSRLRMAEAVELLALYGDSQPEQIVKDIKDPSRDVLKVRVVQTRNSVGFLTLDYAAKVVQSLKDFLAYGASMEMSAAPYLLKPNTAGAEFIRTCRFGHTFKGSFGFTVESRIVGTRRALPGMENLVPLPFARRVTERVARGLDLAKRAGEEKSSKVVVDNFSQGLNANMCESLSKMLNSLESVAIEYKLHWSPSWPLGELTPVSAIRLDRSASPYLEEAASKLKHADDPSNVTIIGQVMELRLEETEGEDEEPDRPDKARRVKIFGRDESGRMFNVRAYLPEEQYRIACDAHKEDRLVRVSGTLVRRGRYWFLELPFGFAIEMEE